MRSRDGWSGWGSSPGGESPSWDSPTWSRTSSGVRRSRSGAASASPRWGPGCSRRWRATASAVDVAHASPRLLAALLAQEQARIFCSHTGVAALGSRWRNLDDAALRRIAERGGVVGIIFGTPYLGSRRLEAVADHLEHAVRVAGEEAVCLGSDFDGLVPLPAGMRDVTDLWKLTALLLERGHPRRRIERILGLNLRRFLVEVLGDVERRRGTPAGHGNRAVDSRQG